MTPPRPSFLEEIKWFARAPFAVGRVVRMLARDIGYFKSVKSREPRDQAGQEIPWFTYPALECVEQWDLSTKRIFEFGTGHSTIYWSRHAQAVVGVESDPQWAARIAARVREKTTLVVEPDATRYAARLMEQEEAFDVIVIDGIKRFQCVDPALARLRRGGVIILDNSDWHERSAARLRAAGLLQVDMTGIGPINPYTWTTSFFFHREFDFPSRGARQPRHGRGSLPYDEEIES
jgi:hypothetical protein